MICRRLIVVFLLFYYLFVRLYSQRNCTVEENLRSTFPLQKPSATPLYSPLEPPPVSIPPLSKPLYSPGPPSGQSWSTANGLETT